MTGAPGPGSGGGRRSDTNDGNDAIGDAASVELRDERYPPIADYALIGDCHSAALVSRSGSIDWCCMPRLDHGSAFGRLLDWDAGGQCRVAMRGATHTRRRYVEGTLVLETRFEGPDGSARLLDCLTTHEGGRNEPHRQVLRIVECVRGRVTIDVEVAPRFDYGDVAPWIRHHHPYAWSATGGDDALLVSGDIELRMHGRHDLVGSLDLAEGERRRLSITCHRPEDVVEAAPLAPDPAELDRRLDATLDWWRGWLAGQPEDRVHDPLVLRSAVVLKALSNARTGAVAAAATTSLPESIGGGRNWDYRYSWIRDSQFTIRSLAELGFDAEADGFRRFIERTAAGSADALHIVYGLGGRRRITEEQLELEGYRGSAPVRVGNAAASQLQLDVYGELLELAWGWHERGESPDDDYWAFLADLVDVAAERWSEPDRGIWETRGPRRHFVHSKVMCWVALDRGLAIAEATGREAPLDRWRQVRDEIRASVEEHGVDHDRGVLRRAYGSDELDAALLLIPACKFVDYEDPLMRRTTDAIVDELSRDGLLQRYAADDGLEGEEGAFVACTFWLAECLALQGRLDEARAAFDRATATANDLGLYSEEFDPEHGVLLGNFPQGLSHLSHIVAAVALDAATRRAAGHDHDS